MVAGYCRLLEPAVAAHAGAGPGTLVFLLLRDLGDESLGGEEQGGDGSRVLQRGPHHLGGVDDARLHEVLVGVAQGVEAFVGLHVADLGHHDRPFLPRVLGDLAKGFLQAAAVVVAKVRDMKTDEGFNALSDTYENLVEAGVIDPTKVVRSALQNAASIASL